MHYVQSISSRPTLFLNQFLIVSFRRGEGGGGGGHLTLPMNTIHWAPSWGLSSLSFLWPTSFAMSPLSQTERHGRGDPQSLALSALSTRPQAISSGHGADAASMTSPLSQTERHGRGDPQSLALSALSTRPHTGHGSDAASMTSPLSQTERPGRGDPQSLALSALSTRPHTGHGAGGAGHTQVLKKLSNCFSVSLHYSRY